ncbi:probable ATP-dependent RNA helicase DHX58 isoform X2 [Syngnathus typhle]|nr:probable ATP-dependent RNA helicase DHX58 isoform X2 [Syngnathus typhle]XP_061160114.1 probable ATP-dependent RNA helicase DHX58 isoform X2 [Syngnathus typhle]
MAGVILHGYQEEVVQRALQGENIIVWLPTGAGKTRAAVYVAHKHLERTPGAKVVVLVNTVHLVEQHYSKEFQPFLGHAYKVTAVSSDSDQKDFLGAVLRDRDLLVCTAQILLNALDSDEEDKHVELSDITLLVVDECHRTVKKTVYNKIMRLYLEKKMSGHGRLPQVLGLTASLGSGGAKSPEKAVQHVLEMCANLDCAIVCAENCIDELNVKIARPLQTFDIVDKRQEDPFGAHVKWMMQAIHAFMEPPEDVTLREFGTQEYESDVVALQKRGVKERDRRLQQCAIHLRQYNDALLIHDTLLMEDALTSLHDFYTETTITDDIDRFLVNLFQDNQAGLLTMARDTRYANPKMEQLESVLLRHFSPNAESRGIIFSKTRRSTQALHRWALAKEQLRSAGIKPATVTGGAGMTQHDRNETIRNFRLGSVNLLIATSVAEEGLDITECNLVVRYGLLTNEIAQQQARGRARAQDSHYSLVAQRGGPEERREHLNTYLEGLTAAAVGTIHQMSPPEFRAKIAQLQQGAWVATEEEKNSGGGGGGGGAGGGGYSAAQVQLLCANCLTAVARGSDIQLLDKTHYVNVNLQFRSRYNQGTPVYLDKTFEDWEPGCIITCNNGNCNKRWGYELKYHKLALLPNLAIKHFALETPGGRTTVKKWKDVPFAVEHLTFSEFCRRHAAHLLD